MTVSAWGLLAAIVLIGVMVFLAVVEAAVSRLTRVSLRVLAERESGPRHRLLDEIARDRWHFLLPLQFAVQVILILLTVCVTVLLVTLPMPKPVLGTILVMLVVVGTFRQLIPLLIATRDPEKTLLRIVPFLAPAYRLLGLLSLPLILVLRRFATNQSVKEDGASPEEELTDQEIQAYLDVGEEDGLFEKEDSELLQSALEFSNTLVREIMTPRNEMVAIEEGATIAELRDLIVSSRHSRIPVFRDRIDQIVGVVYVRTLLANLDPGNEGLTILPLMNEPFFVPETKKVSDLLADMQAEGERLAVVVNEYGTVSGLVTVEDLLEEIVGEIRDEDEFERVDLVYEGKGSYIVRGNVPVEEVEEVLRVNLGDRDVATVSGLVVATLGKVPVPGETVELNGLSVEILSSDPKKIHTMRIRHARDSAGGPTTALG